MWGLNTDSVYLLYHSTSFLVKKADDRQLLSEANVLGARYEPTFVPWQFCAAHHAFSLVFVEGQWEVLHCKRICLNPATGPQC